MSKVIQLKNKENEKLYPKSEDMEDVSSLITFNNETVQSIQPNTLRAVKWGNIVEISALGILNPSVVKTDAKDYNLFTLDKKICPKTFIYFNWNFGIGQIMWWTTTPQYGLLNTDGEFYFKKQVEGNDFQIHIIYLLG